MIKCHLGITPSKECHEVCVTARRCEALKMWESEVKQMRLIDGDALKKEFPKDTDWEYPVNTNGYVCETIDEQPTIDAVEVVRCKDCKHWRDDHTCREHSLVSPMGANEFCSRGERGDSDD